MLVKSAFVSSSQFYVCINYFWDISYEFIRCRTKKVGIMTQDIEPIGNDTVNKLELRTLSKRYPIGTCSLFELTKKMC